jgi:ATP synthase protein I
MREDRRKLSGIKRYSAIGLEMGFCVAIGVAIGYFLDRYFDTEPWLLLIFLILGVVAGFRRLFYLMKDLTKNERRK